MTNPHTCETVKLLGLPPVANEQEQTAEECLNVEWKRNCTQTFTRPLPQIKQETLFFNLMKWRRGGMDLSTSTVSSRQVEFRGNVLCYFRNCTMIHLVKYLKRSVKLQLGGGGGLCSLFGLLSSLTWSQSAKLYKASFSGQQQLAFLWSRVVMIVWRGKSCFSCLPEEDVSQDWQPTCLCPQMRPLSIIRI